MIDYFLSLPNVTLHLIGHVVGEERHIENDYAVNYGTDNNFKKYKKGWYLPTAAEARMLAKSNIPQMQMPKLNLPDYNMVETYAPVVTIDSSINVEGSVDATVISDMKKFRDETRDDLYQYISDKMYRGYIHSGGKRRI